MDDTSQHVFCAVPSQARNCLPGLSVSHEHSVTSPDKVLKHILDGNGAVLTKATLPPPESSRTPEEMAPQNILFTSSSVKKQNSWMQFSSLITIKLACLSNK